MCSLIYHGPAEPLAMRLFCFAYSSDLSAAVAIKKLLDEIRSFAFDRIYNMFRVGGPGVLGLTEGWRSWFHWQWKFTNSMDR